MLVTDCPSTRPPAGAYTEVGVVPQGETVVAFDAGRFKELDAMVRRMGAIVSVFDVRSSTLGNKSFSAFRDMMDVYIDLCTRELKQGKDFTESGLKPTPTDVETTERRVRAGVRQAPGSVHAVAVTVSPAAGGIGRAGGAGAAASRATSAITQSRNALTFGRSWVPSRQTR